MQDSERLFVGKYPCGIVYADRGREVSGDYVRLGFLPYGSLVLEIAKGCPDFLRREIEDHAATVQARRGEDFSISACGQTVRLGREG